MKQTTKNILGVAAIVLLSSGVAGLTTYKMLQKNMPADSTSAFNEMFQQNPNVRLASYNAVDAAFVCTFITCVFRFQRNVFR